jgi:hypothetical protein
MAEVRERRGFALEGACAGGLAWADPSTVGSEAATGILERIVEPAPSAGDPVRPTGPSAMGTSA